MGYSGIVAYIPVGREGLQSDNPQEQTSPLSLISALNLSFENQLIEKEPGSQRWNQRAPLPSGVVSFFDYFPEPHLQRVIVVCKNGRVYRFTNSSSFTEVTPTVDSTAPTTLTPTSQTHIVQGGIGATKKLFILTGNDPIQVISGDGLTRDNLSLPAADWPDDGTNFPSFGLVHKSRFFVMGVESNPYRLYGSTASDQQDFQSGTIFTDNVYPGEGDKLSTAYVFNGKMFLFKFPFGSYVLNDTDTSSANWFTQKLSSNFGVASEHAVADALGDLLLANSEGSVTSLAATEKFGDVESADILQILKNESYMRQTTSQRGNQDRWALYYPDKKQTFFTYRGAGTQNNSRILKIDQSVRGVPRVSWTDKDQPNCLAHIRDGDLVQRPHYGANDGYVYSMDNKDRIVDGLDAPDSLSAALAGGGAGNLSDGKYRYRVTFSDGSNETEGGYITQSAEPITFDFVDGDVTVGSDTITETGHNLPNGATVRLSNFAGTLPAGLSTNTDYYVVERTATTFKLSLTSGGSAVDITAAAGGGTHTLITVDAFDIEVFDATSDGQISLTNIPVDPSDTATERKVYRSIVDDFTDYFLLTTISDNTTTTFTDNVADGSLGASAPTVNTFDAAYRLEFQTPYLDFSFIDPKLKEVNKLFHFLEVDYEPTGRWNLSCDVFIDGVFFETINFEVSHGPVLDDFVMDTDKVSGRIPRTIRKPLHGMGRRISLKFYNAGKGQNIRVPSVNIYFKASAQQQQSQEP